MASGKGRPARTGRTDPDKAPGTESTGTAPEGSAPSTEGETGPPPPPPPTWWSGSDRVHLVMAIDVGVTNVGVAFLTFDARWERPRVEYVERVDLARLDRALAPDRFDGNEPSDRVARFLARFRDMTAPCGRVYIERQPFAPCKVVEQLLYEGYGDRAVLVSPNSVQAHFGFAKRDGFDYEARKDFVTRLAERIVLHGPDGAGPGVAETWSAMADRQHDMADAVAIGLFVGEATRRAGGRRSGRRSAPTAERRPVRTAPGRRHRNRPWREEPRVVWVSPYFAQKGGVRTVLAPDDPVGSHRFPAQASRTRDGDNRTRVPLRTHPPCLHEQQQKQQERVIRSPFFS